MSLQPSDLKVGRVFSAKRPRSSGSLLNDRQIVYVSPLGDQVQYDSPAVAFGRKLPIVTVDEFLKWAKDDVTHLMPKDDWRAA